MKRSVPLIIISHYDKRPVEHLTRLVRSISETEDRELYDIAVVVNSEGSKPVTFDQRDLQINILYRSNQGMNIGSWNYGWQTLSLYNMYLFIQDECVALRSGWLSAYLECLSRPNIGLVGESLNWDLPWSVLRDKHIKPPPGHEIDGEPANRIDVYLKCFANWGINLGATGGHLQALLWGATRETLEQIDGFPEGRNKAECIASEIGVSRKVVSMGKQVVQIEPKKFSWFSHPQWDRNR